MGWNLAMQENIDDSMLSRAYSYERSARSSPCRSASSPSGRSAAAFGFEQVLVASGIAYVAICALVLCSRSVRDLPRAPATPVAEVTTGTS